MCNVVPFSRSGSQITSTIVALKVGAGTRSLAHDGERITVRFALIAHAQVVSGREVSCGEHSRLGRRLSGCTRFGMRVGTYGYGDILSHGRLEP